MNSPIVSLVTTVYNREQYLPAMIESTLTQTYQDFELLIWDDGSTDDSVEIAHYYAAQDSRIRVIASPHLGRGAALQAAIAETKGIYLGLVDSDDLLAQTALEETVHLLSASPSTGLVYTDYQCIDEISQVASYGRKCRIPYSKEQLLVSFMVFHFRLMRRSVYDQVGGFDPKFVCAQDYDLCLKFSEVTEIVHLKKPLYYYRVHYERISGRKRIEQVYWSQQAVQDALERRGLAETYDLRVDVSAQFTLLPVNGGNSI